MRTNDVVLARALLVIPPLLLVAGWSLLIANAGRGPDDAWAGRHLVLFVANAMWVPAMLAIIRLTGSGRDDGRRSPRFGLFALGLVIFGSVCVAGQLAVDLVAWALALDAAQLRELFAAMRARPVLLALFYLIGPPLLLAGLLIGAMLLQRLGGRARAGGRTVAAGLVVVLVGALSTFSLVTLAGYVAVLAGFALVATTIDATDLS